MSLRLNIRFTGTMRHPDDHVMLNPGDSFDLRDNKSPVISFVYQSSDEATLSVRWDKPMRRTIMDTFRTLISTLTSP